MLKWIISLSDSLFGPECTQKVLIEHDFNFFNSPTCSLEHVIRKIISIGIIAGSSLVKLPQIFKILLTQSAAGLSLLAYLLEMLSSTITFAYNFRAGNPFIMYGETVFITIQNGLLVLLTGFYGKRVIQLLLITVLYSVLLSCLFVPQYVTDEQMSLLQALTIPISALARFPQIFQIWYTGNSGQLSSISLFLTMVGSFARLYTTISEGKGKDSILFTGFATTAALNTILFLQVVVYTSNRRRVTNIKKGKKKDE